MLNSGWKLYLYKNWKTLQTDFSAVLFYIIRQEEVYFGEFLLSQPKNPSNGTELRILSFKPSILTPYVWDHITKGNA